MKKKSRKHFSLQKINISKLTAVNATTVLGGNEPYTGEKQTCDLDTCTSSRSTVDYGGNRTDDGNP